MEPQLVYGGFKIRLEDLPDEAWEYIVGGQGEAPDLRKYYRSVAWLNRGVKVRANRVSRVPFAIYKGDTEIDTSDDWQNALMFMPDIKRLIWLVEAGLTLSGKSYLRVDRRSLFGRGVPAGLHNMRASTIKPVYAQDGMEDFIIGDVIGFERRISGKTEFMPLEDVVYFWSPDDSVEIGPPSDWPALAALQAAGVLHSVANFANMFFERGAIKVTLLTTKGHIIESERSRLKTWWDRIRGKAWASEIINADQLDAIPIGEGLESLDNTELTSEQREDISTALGVPHSLVFSNAANYATAQQDEINFYEDTILPECELIQEAINDQLLMPLGYRLVFDPQSMPLYQEDEEQRAQAFESYVNVGVRPSIVGEMLGLTLPDKWDFPDLDEKYERSMEMGDMLAEQGGFGNSQREEEDEDEDDEKNYIYVDLEKWQRKAINRIKAGHNPACEFESDYIPPLLNASIEGALESTTNNQELVRDLFRGPWLGYP